MSIVDRLRIAIVHDACGSPACDASSVPADVHRSTRYSSVCRPFQTQRSHLIRFNSILGTASSLLTTLGNPHNLSLLTSHLLTAPALWDTHDGVQTPLRLLSVFHTAITTVINYHNDVRHHKVLELLPGQVPTGGGLSLDDWVRAVVSGADERSQRWKHLIVLGGLLIGIGSLEEQGMDLYWTSGVRRRIEGGFVRAANLALVEVRERAEADGLGGHTIALTLNHGFGCLSNAERVLVDYDLLLPVLIGTAYFSNEGFQSAYFLGGLDLDVKTQGEKLDWPVRTPYSDY